MPTIDVETRWGYTYMMVRDFLSSGNVCNLYRFLFFFKIRDVINCIIAIDFFADVKKIRVFQLLKKRWNILLEFEHVLSVPYKATIDLQNQNLTLSDAFGVWLKMKLYLSNIAKAKKNHVTGLSQRLLETLEERHNTIFANPFMSAALYLDPRYRSMIANDEIKTEEAIKTLENIWRRLIVMSSPVPANTSIDITDESEDTEPEFDPDEALDKLLLGSTQKDIQMRVEQEKEADIRMLLEMFNPTPVGSKTDIISFWEGEKENNEELYKLAMVVFAVPPTEVQIERDFSKLNFVFSDRRCKLSEERLEDIMVINFNKDLFRVVKEEELIAQKTKAKTM